MGILLAPHPGVPNTTTSSFCKFLARLRQVLVGYFTTPWLTALTTHFPSNPPFIPSFSSGLLAQSPQINYFLFSPKLTISCYVSLLSSLFSRDFIIHGDVIVAMLIVYWILSECQAVQSVLPALHGLHHNLLSYGPWAFPLHKRGNPRLLVYITYFFIPPRMILSPLTCLLISRLWSNPALCLSLIAFKQC